MNTTLLVDCRFLGESGIGRYLVEILRSLDVREIDVWFLGSSSIIKEYLDIDSNIIEFISPVFSFSEQIEFVKIQKEFDVFWTPHFNIPFFTTLAKKNIVTLHDGTPLMGSFDFIKKFYFIFAILIIKLKKYHVIFDSHFIASQFEIVNFTEQFIIPLAPKDIFKLNRSISEQYDNKKLRYALCVGNLKPHKNLKIVIDYWNTNELISDKYRLVIVGAGDLRTSSKESLIISSAGNKKIEFLDRVCDEDLVNLYQNASFFIMPSFSEGFGLPVLEAQACGTLVLCSTATSLPEVGGIGCIYFDPSSFQSFSNAIIVAENIVIASEIRKLGSDNICRFSWSKASSQLLDIIISK